MSASAKSLIAEAKATESVERIVELSKHADASVRLAAVKQICPCRVKADVDTFWDRVLGESGTLLSAAYMMIITPGSRSLLNCIPPAYRGAQNLTTAIMTSFDLAVRCRPYAAEMIRDEDATVRAQVLHTLCDGSPAHLESRVAEALDVFIRDTDSGIRRTANRVLATYTRTGKWNVL